MRSGRECLIETVQVVWERIDNLYKSLSFLFFYYSKRCKVLRGDNIPHVMFAAKETS